MKKTLLFIIFLYAVRLFSQEYSIQNNEILLILGDNSLKNECLIKELRTDSSLNRSCKSLVIDGIFKYLPHNIYHIDWIEQLQINISDTVFIDKNFSKFKKLEGLLIFGGHVNIEKKVNLPNIKYLKLQYVKFINGKFPEAILNWINLTDIIVTEGNINTIPNNIIKLNKLEILGLSNNNINSIPDELYSLESLQNLSIYGNKLKKISPKICNMKSLKYIHLDRNLIIDDRVSTCLKARIIRFDEYNMPYEEDM
ncbi:MAG: leucine-rich repeat domain-containing protein [Prevotella sp.]|jgi:Leucine-rich repeat (LRR) protein|nr:leucine-rich repeat domain-containing protein [Prevotella sp.]